MQMLRDSLTLSPGPIPLYHQLERDLRARILAGEYAAGALLPTEERFCEQYGISRITVRRALDALIAEGLITKKRGVGTFVAELSTGGVRSVHLSGSLDEFLASAGALATQVLSMGEVSPPEEAARALRLQDGEMVTRLELLNFLDGVPLGYLELYLPVAIGRQVQPIDVGNGVPVIRMIEGKFGSRVVRAEQVLEADTAGEAAAKYLDLEPTTPVLKVTRIYYDTADHPMEAVFVRNHPERYRYSVDFKARPTSI